MAIINSVHKPLFLIQIDKPTERPALFLASRDRNKMYGACCSLQMTHEQIKADAGQKAPGVKSLLS